MYDLKALQNKEIEILQAVHDACEKLGIEYVIISGTLLGAVRHHGFIPWDDDIDICMTRDNYDRFIEFGHRYLPEHLKIQHVRYEKECPNFYAKVRDSNTTFLHEEHVGLNINQGVFIDVFPMDRIRSGVLSVTTEYYRRKFFNVINACYNLSYVKTIKRPFSKLMGYMIHYLITRGIMVGTTRTDYIKNEDERRRKLHRKGDDYTFISFDVNRTFFTFKIKGIGLFSLLTQRKLYEFDGHSFYGPADYDTVLTLAYGNYMIIPPKNQQINHRPRFVDLNKGYNKDELDKMIKEGII